MQPHIEIQSLGFSRPHRVVLSEVDMTIARHRITAIMGPSGCGKTTLLRLLCAQLKPSSGSVFINGQNIHQLKRKDLYRLRQGIGVLFQSGALFNQMSVFDNVAFALRAHTSWSERMIRDQVLLKLEAVGLRGVAQLMPSALSGGMCRRVAIARAIVMDPQILIYDEPFAGQDPIAKGVLLRLIKQLNASLGLTSIIVSHDVKETAQLADFIYVLSSGTVTGQGAPEVLLGSTQPAIQQFLSGVPDGVVPFHYPAVPIEQALFP